MTLSYRPWVPREGMAGMFKHLVKAWGNPNSPRETKWPHNVLDKVCTRGTPLEIRYDQYANTHNLYYWASQL